MPFLHKQCKTDHLNSRKTVQIKPKTGFISVLYENGLLYEGNWANNKREEFGGLIKKNIKCKIFKPKYKGAWHEDKKYGLGNGYYPGDGYYVGQWKNNMRYGYGKMWYSDGSFYAGYWKCDKRCGKGLFVEVNGNRYEGEWVNDMTHGYGRYFHLMAGQMQEGIWENNIARCTTMEDIPFRQSVVSPSSYPIPVLEVISPDKILLTEQKKFLPNSEYLDGGSISEFSFSIDINSLN